MLIINGNRRSIGILLPFFLMEEDFMKMEITKRELVGLVIFCVGVCMAESENLLIPLAFVLTGLFLAKGLFGKEFEEEEKEGENNNEN